MWSMYVVRVYAYATYLGRSKHFISDFDSPVEVTPPSLLFMLALQTVQPDWVLFIKSYIIFFKTTNANIRERLTVKFAYILMIGYGF